MDEITQRGLSKPTPGSDAVQCVSVVTLYALSYVGVLLAPTWPLRVLALVVCAGVLLQAGYISHDLAHRHFTSRRWLNVVLEQVFMTVLCGQAFGHWRTQHLTHHQHAQHPFKDPDLEVALFALSEVDAARKRGFCRITTRWQGLLLWPAVTLQAFSIRWHSLAFMARRPAAADLAFFAVHLALWVGLPAWVLGLEAAVENYLLLTWFIGPYLAAAFMWNHLGMPVFDDQSPEGFVERQVFGARSLRNTGLYARLFGSLNLHPEHHLAPNVPAARLPEVRPLLHALLAERGITIREQQWLEAMGEVMRYIARVGQAATQTSATDGTDATQRS